MVRQVMLITGASSGIGAELAKLASADGHDLVLVARDRGALQSLADALMQRHGNTVRVLPKDVSEPSAAQEIFDQLQAAGIAVDILINNAGFGSYGLFWRDEAKRIADMMQVNAVALTQLCRLYIPEMVARGHGKVLNVASVAAFAPGPLMAVYYASKAYVLSLSEAIANELKGTGVTVTALCPGPTRTRFEERAGLDLSTWVPVSDAQAVAQAGYRAMMRGQRLAIPGVLNRVVAFGARLVPRGLVIAIARLLQEKANAKYRSDS